MTSSRVVLLAVVAFVALAASLPVSAEEKIMHPLVPGGPAVQAIDARTTLRAVQAVAANNRNRITSCEDQLAEIRAKAEELEQGRASDLETTTETIGAVDDRVTDLDSRLTTIEAKKDKGAEWWVKLAALVGLAMAIRIAFWCLRFAKKTQAALGKLRDWCGEHHHGDDRTPTTPAPTDAELWAEAKRRARQAYSGGESGDEAMIPVTSPPSSPDLDIPVDFDDERDGSDDASGALPVPPPSSPG